MNNEEFLATLPSEISRATVLSQLKGQYSDIVDNLEPSLALAIESFPKNVTFRSEIGKKVEAKLVRSRMTTQRNHWMFDAQIAVANIKAVLPTMIKQIESVDGPTIFTAGLDLRMVNVLRLGDANRFILNYIPMLLLWVTSAESAVALPSAKVAFSVGIRNWLSDNLGAFAALMALYMTPPDVVIKALNSILKIPAVNIDYTAVQAVQGQKLEAMRFSLLDGSIIQSVISGVSYRLMKIWTEYSVARYNERKELKSALELRLIELKMARNSETDPVLTRRIVYTEDRLAKLNAKIREFEETAYAG